MRLSRIGVSCGTETDLTRAHVHGSVPVRTIEATRLTAIERICRALDSDELSSVEAESLHGKLSYILSRGKMGRAALQPLVLRVISSVTEDVSLDASLRSSLRFLEMFLDRDVPACTLFPIDRRQGTIVIFSDAQTTPPMEGFPHGKRTVAYVVFLPSGRVLFSWTVVSSCSVSSDP